MTQRAGPFKTRAAFQLPIEHRLALGEKRALAARTHLIRLGVSGDRLITISYGEEDPAAPGRDEAVWAKNRRSEFNKPVSGSR